MGLIFRASALVFLTSPRCLDKLGEKTKLSQEELAKKAGITYSTLIKIESGANDNPTIKTLIKIADALEVSLDMLVERSKK